jgi:hypothetical protein
MDLMTDSDKQRPALRRGYSINEFCRAYGISRASFYNYKRAGIGPRIMQVGSRRIITDEAEEEWRRERERATDAAAL